MLQFPWRFLGPLGVCLAVAGAGALALPLSVLDRWGRSGKALGLVAVVAAGIAVAWNGLGNRDLALAAGSHRVIDASAVREDEARNDYGLGTTTRREFLPRDVQIATYTPGAPRGRGVFEHLYPEADWQGGLFLPMSGSLRLLAWRAEPGRLNVRIANDGQSAGSLGIHQFRFPGWRAWVDGKPADLGVAPYIPEQQAALGFMVVAVPPGEHTVGIAFGPTPVRLVAVAISLATQLALVWTGTRRLRGWWPTGLLVAGWLLAGLGCGAVAWSNVRPLVARFVGPPSAAPSVQGGVWGLGQAPGQARTGGRLVLNLAEAMRSGQVTIASPSGPALGPDRFLDVRFLAVTDPDRLRGAAGTSQRQWLYMHPPSRATVRVRLPAVPAGGDVVLQAALALDPATWTAPEGDGVRFQALVTPVTQDGRTRVTPATVLDEEVNPRARTEQRRWVSVEADLSRWAGAVVEITLQTQPNNDTAYDWAGWGSPAVVVRDSARLATPARAD
jgi:hypothetical protein